MAKKTSRSKGTRPIRQNRPGWRKEVIGYTSSKNKYQKPIKIKGEKYIKVKK